jgi:hypothetical protein
VAAHLPIDIRQHLEAIEKTITGEALASSGKKNPAQAGGKLVPKKPKVEDEVEKDDETKHFVPFAKADKHLVTGIVLQPEVTDAHRDIISAEVIEKAAHNFLAKFGKQTKVGLQHSSFKTNEDRFSLVESWIAPMDMTIGSMVVKTGSWIMTWKVHDKKLWQSVKDGKITGFSIGGMARAKKLTPKVDL